MKNKFALVGVLIVAAVVGTVFYMKSQQQGDLNAGEGGFKLKGPSGAAVKMVEYSDFQCPACKRAQPALKDFLGKYPDKVSLEFRHFPLGGHVWAAVAHQSAECAGQQGKFWEYHDKLFETQSDWSKPQNPVELFIQFAKDFGLDLDAFGSCLTDEKVKASVMAEKKTGVDLQVRSTPTVFFNEERLVGPAQVRQKGEDMIRQALGLPPLEKKEPEAEDHTGHDHG